VKNESFKTTERKGRYILKPQFKRWEHVPENEDLTMRLASAVGIEVPVHGPA
jgi:serine/threonine-protein kinase HipA